MPALTEYSNVYNTALLVLQAKGFRTWYDEGQQAYCCERGGWDFISPSPCGLLGLVAIFEWTAPEEFRAYWWRQDGPQVYGNLTREAPKYRSVSGGRPNDP